MESFLKWKYISTIFLLLASMCTVVGHISSLYINNNYCAYFTQPFWGMTDVLGMIGLYDEFKDLPFRFDTDVNAPAVAEFNLTPTSTSSTSAAYVTVGTGIGVGLVVNNLSVKGLLHPEAGHIEVRQLLVLVLISVFLSRMGSSFVNICECSIL